MAGTATSRFSLVFGRRSAVVIGMIHVEALPGTPRNHLAMDEIVEKAKNEAQTYKKAGIDAIMIENMHDLPYLNRHVGPEITAAMSVICSEVKKSAPLIPCGVQILSGANKEAMAVAKATGMDFIRTEGFVFSHVGDEGMFNSDAGELLRYRRMIDAENVLVFTDIKKKHSSHAITQDIDIVNTAKAAEFFQSDGVIITGESTGEPANYKEVVSVKEAVNIPLLIGSGVDLNNIKQYLGASALIIGSHFKEDGHWSKPVCFDRVRSFMAKVESIRK